ncbi:MAG: TIGR00282 family metallophosphoesterase [bacterium]|nr:TIGR00282 family metallophosphoesterase [bacterium]
MKILVFADVVGRVGREAVKLVLPDLLAEHTPLLTIANIENLAHGTGITLRTVCEMKEMGIDVFTGGNHIWDNPRYTEVFGDKELGPMLVRPINDVKVVPGEGKRTFEKNGFKVTVINVMGTVFFRDEYPSPFDALDEAMGNIPEDHIILIDMHTEATSEKALIGRYVDGRASAIWGSHTHVPTADERILPNGTAFISDVGMCGAHNESIGIRYDLALQLVKDKKKTYLEPPRHGMGEVNAILLTFDDGSQKPSKIERIRRLVDVPERTLDE